MMGMVGTAGSWAREALSERNGKEAGRVKD